MSNRTPYIEEIRAEIKNGMLKKPTAYEIENSEEYDPARTYCEAHNMNIAKIGVYKIVALNEAIRLGLGTVTKIVQNIFNCNNVFEMEKRYK